MYATTKREFLGYYAQNFKDAGSERLQGECFSILYILISEIRESEFLLKAIYIAIYNKSFIKYYFELKIDDQKMVTKLRKLCRKKRFHSRILYSNDKLIGKQKKIRYFF